jgi:hypothetical protein
MQLARLQFWDDDAQPLATRQSVFLLASTLSFKEGDEADYFHALIFTMLLCISLCLGCYPYVSFPLFIAFEDDQCPPLPAYG